MAENEPTNYQKIDNIQRQVFNETGSLTRWVIVRIRTTVCLMSWQELIDNDFAIEHVSIIWTDTHVGAPDDDGMGYFNFYPKEPYPDAEEVSVHTWGED